MAGWGVKAVRETDNGVWLERCGLVYVTSSGQCYLPITYIKCGKVASLSMEVSVLMPIVMFFAEITCG